ncbi:MAG: carbohydrate-binding family 9-like protein [Marinifilaceae bacterium]|jgi:hypothetical protein
MEDVDSLKLPQLYIYNGKKLTLPETHFKHSVGGDSIEERTLVQVMYDEEHLVIEFECLDNPRTTQNHYREHNTPMWNQEVFELFIAEGKEDPTRYIELEINPNNALFAAHVSNPDKEGTQLELDFIDIEASGIQSEVEINDKGHSWKGKLQIPFRILGGETEKPSDVYRINFYRIISNQDREEEFWEGSAEDCTYACWNSTLSPEQPCFHRSAFFGVLHLI